MSRVLILWSFCLVCNSPKQGREARRAIGMQTRCMRGLLYHDQSVHSRLDLRQRKVYSIPRCLLCPPHDSNNVFRYSAFRLKQVVLNSLHLKHGFRIRNSFEIRSTVLLTSSVRRVFADVFFFYGKTLLSEVHRWNFAYVECYEMRDAPIRNTTRTKSSFFQYILNLQAEVKCRKNPLRYRYRPTSC